MKISVTEAAEGFCDIVNLDDVDSDTKLPHQPRQRYEDRRSAEASGREGPRRAHPPIAAQAYAWDSDSSGFEREAADEIRTFSPFLAKSTTVPGAALSQLKERPLVLQGFRIWTVGPRLRSSELAERETTSEGALLEVWRCTAVSTLLFSGRLSRTSPDRYPGGAGAGAG